jgi:hypothetical protein
LDIGCAALRLRIFSSGSLGVHCADDRSRHDGRSHEKGPLGCPNGP